MGLLFNYLYLQETHMSLSANLAALSSFPRRPRWLCVHRSSASIYPLQLLDFQRLKQFRPLSLITKNTISVRGRVPMVPFLRRARRPPRAPQSNHCDQLHHQGARPPRQRLRVVRFADPSLRLRPGRERRRRVRAQLVAAKSPATAGAKI
jgi:hypothetical protein